MKVIITGGTRMIGNLVLNKCLNSDKITGVISLVRKLTGNKHNKLTEIVVSNFEDYTELEQYFKDISIAFLCLGAYTSQVDDDLFKKITLNYALEFAKTLEKKSPKATICLHSGAGADRIERSKTSFALYKGMAEILIAKLNLKFYSFRPAYIYPVDARKEPNAVYKIIKALFPVINAFGDKYSIKSSELANVMFNIGIYGADKQILENQDIFKYKGKIM